MRRLLVAKEKTGVREFEVEDDASLQKVALDLLRERFREGYWYTGEDAKTVASILNDSDGIAAWAFLRTRRTRTNEWVDLVFDQ